MKTLLGEMVTVVVAAETGYKIWSEGDTRCVWNLKSATPPSHPAKDAS
jgi:hypothetical protein